MASVPQTSEEIESCRRMIIARTKQLLDVCDELEKVKTDLKQAMYNFVTTTQELEEMKAENAKMKEQIRKLESQLSAKNDALVRMREHHAEQERFRNYQAWVVNSM